MENKFIAFVICSLFYLSASAQTETSRLSKVLEKISENNLTEALTLLEKISKCKEKDIVSWYHNFYDKKDTTFVTNNDTIESSFSQSLRNCREGDLLFYNPDKTDDDVAFQKYLEALAIAETQEYTPLNKFILFKILNLLYDNRHSIDVLEQYNNKLLKIAETANDEAIYAYYDATIKAVKNNNEQVNSYKKLLEPIEKINLPLIKGATNQMLGVQYDHFLQQSDSAIYYYKAALEQYKSIQGNLESNKLFGIYNNIGVAYTEKLDFPNAIENLNNASHYLNDDLDKKSYLYLAYAETYEKWGKFDSAYYYLVKQKSITQELEANENAIAYNDINVKYKTAEKEKEIILQKQQKERNRNVAIGLSALILLGSSIFYLYQKNIKKKQLIAEQEREIQIQKTEKVLKEQELNTIDAMLAGQEKERKKLAEDLHDSVGATLAAAKLQFNHISQHRDKLNTLDELFSKTSVLLDDAYSEIRSMAHLKNSGVIAKDGLIPALKKLANNASSKNGLQVSVENFGLEQRLDNTQEITIFRIIQELVTNIIKHAKATEAVISLTPHEKELNIIIEDNGKGFNPRDAINKDGMGLANIERRVEHIEGTMEIDSTPGNGTTILIDIPL